ncbi:hypothetical protein LBW89_08790 [Paenibacillus sp. alder61]|uniref:hypothetical protein n=1 Tax=Paenibacillus sp. alder61 TaxID=2862948 RepID=UPI001CD7A383|nr:hypothetical protein [Paenibacillus sp. alder61]MCA1293113.1 hypothetical protein [Paenibacillus sp. alder61]
MKAVPKVNTDGLFIEDTLVDDAFTGVVPFYIIPDTEDTDKTPEPILAGYTVGIPVTPGLYNPRFNLEAWEAYQDELSAAEEAYKVAYNEWSVQSEDERGEPPVYVAPEQPQLWGEGLTPEKIEELTRSNPQNPSSTDLLGAELTSMKLQNIQQQQTISALGAELAAVKLDVIKLRGVEQA